MTSIPNYIAVVDGHAFTTDSRSAIAWLFRHAKSTMAVEEWNDARAEYVPVPQHVFQSWE